MPSCTPAWSRRRRDAGLDDQVVDAAHCVDISEPKTVCGLVPDYRLYTARRTLGRSAGHLPAAAHGRTRPGPAATTRHR
ncbi:hypothetical protein [Streptomyces goshikiensis]|uniref:hypothetical protein n=1 Tax=Streptomyces goshikiensis TaxID=1942 RepID=UPI003647B939